MLKVMLDTNVLLDYYLGRNPVCGYATRLLTRIYEQETVPYVSSLTLKDLFYLLSMTLKRMARTSKDGTLAQSDARAANDIAWTCMQQTLKRSVVIGIDKAVCLQACVYRNLHGDFEDCLQLAAARKAGVELLVTSDADLAKHAPVACMGPGDALELLEAEAKAGRA